jgi:hypothetical protein
MTIGGAILLAVLVAGPGDRATAGDLTRLRADALLACAGAGACQASDWDLARELARREKPHRLLARLRGAKPAQRRVLVFALTVIPPDAGVTRALRDAARSDDEEVRYHARNALAKGCDEEALGAFASEPDEVPAPCEQWASTLALVGTCRYAPGARLLVAQLDHACGNVVAAALQSLRVIFPDAPRRFDTFSAEKEYFEVRVASQPEP